MGGVLGEDEGERLGLELLGQEFEVLSLFVGGPALSLDLAEMKELVGGPLEITLVLL